MIAGKRVVVTGRITGESRQTAEAKLRDAGAIVQSTVTGETDVLVTGAKVGAVKIGKATASGVAVGAGVRACSRGDSERRRDREGKLEREGPSSCGALAAGIHRLRMSVLHALRDDDRFVQTGRGRATRWHVRQDSVGNGNETGYFGTNGTGGTNGSEADAESAGAFPATCEDPALHKSWGAHYTGSGGRHCIRCESPGIPPLTDDEYEDGLGGQERRQALRGSPRGRASAAIRRGVSSCFARSAGGHHEAASGADQRGP